MARTRIIQTRLMPRSRFYAITIFGMIFTRDRGRLDKYDVNHERIHCRQQLEWLYIPFFIIYLFEWLFYLIKYRNSDRAYRAISFEREAYSNERDLDYLTHRKFYANFRRKKPQ